MVAAVDHAAEPGDVVQVYDKHGALFGRGLFNPDSEIVLRLLTHADEPINDAFWRGRLRSAIALRERLQLSVNSDAYRLVHAEGDGLSGLVIERYADVLAVEVFALGIWRRVDEIVALLRDVTPTTAGWPDVWRVVVRADERAAALERFTPQSPPKDAPQHVEIREHGLRYRVDLTAGHKTGFFCDQRENRARLGAFCRDADVLDLCCYTAGFALNAAVRGGARHVTAVDLDETALAIAKRNADLNQTRISFAHSDAFTYLRQMRENGRRFDVVVLDPPKFALNRAGLEEALRRYSDLNALALQVVSPGGLLLTCSCSGLVSRSAFRGVIGDAARRTQRRLQCIDSSGAGADHPVMLDCPEGEYLKAEWLRVV